MRAPTWSGASVSWSSWKRPCSARRWSAAPLRRAASGKRRGLTIVGIWERGHFELPRPETSIEATTVLVLAGSEPQLDRLSELMAIYSPPDAPVLILGGGRVGRAAAQALLEREIPHVIVEQDTSRVRPGTRYEVGSAADLEVLERAGIRNAPSTIVTTNDDATNTYLTIYCRRLRPDMQLISRATLERNISTLHRAGADFVMSYASMGANAIYNLLEGGDIVMLAEGLDIFRHPIPPQLAGRTLTDTNIRDETGCQRRRHRAERRRQHQPSAGLRASHRRPGRADLDRHDRGRAQIRGTLRRSRLSRTAQRVRTSPRSE